MPPTKSTTVFRPVLAWASSPRQNAARCTWTLLRDSNVFESVTYRQLFGWRQASGYMCPDRAHMDELTLIRFPGHHRINYRHGADDLSTCYSQTMLINVTVDVKHHYS